MLSTIVILILAWAVPASAQSDGAPENATKQAITLFSPQISSFPSISMYLDVRTPQGDFLHDLKPEQVSILEDGVQLHAGELVELNNGAQFVVAINPAPSFAIRDAMGRIRSQPLYEALKSWADRHTNTSDDISLLITNGPAITHVASSADWQAGLQSYQGDQRNAVPSMEALVRALDTAADPEPRPGMGRAVLFITPFPEGSTAAGLSSLKARAIQEGVRVFVWMVAAPDQFDLPATAQLSSLAADTGGQFFAFSGTEALPDPEAYISPLRYTYKLDYQSQIRTPGSHTIAIAIQAGEGEAGKLTSAERSFPLDVKPPNPMLVSPPAQIVRTVSDAEPGKPLTLSPIKETLSALVEFPDGYTRSLAATFLIVDGITVAVNTNAPYDNFNWDLGMYVANGEHRVKVVAEDSLGLTGSSVETPVKIIIQRPATNILLTVYRNGPLFAGMVIVFAGAVLLLVLILGGRIRPQAFGQKEAATASLRITRKNNPNDPVTQPVEAAQAQAERRLSAWMSRFHRPHRLPVPKAYAYFTPISEGDGQAPLAPIPLQAEETSIGRDASKASITLEDPSVEPLHASLKREGETYRLADAGSVAGTWVNYTPVSKEGVLLEHGDLIHIGRVSFRYSLGEPARLPKPVVTREEVQP